MNKKETLEMINRLGDDKPTYESVLEDHYLDDSPVTRDYMVWSGCKNEIKMLSLRLNNLLRKGFTEEELQPLYNQIKDYSTLKHEVFLK